MTPEQREELIRILRQEEEISREWARILFPPEKREYELVYEGKEREEDILANTMAVPLQPVRTFGATGKESWQNKLIFGDNLQAMKSLLEMKRDGRLCSEDGTPGVKLIYIDPPFATRREFKGSKDQKAYQDKIVGGQFLEFLRKRMVLLRELLADDGSFYLHLDTKKIHYAKALMDEVIGEGKFSTEIVWKRTSAHSDSSSFANVHDTILFYKKSERTQFFPQFSPYTDEHIAKRYSHIEKDGRRFTDGDLVATGLKGGGYTYKWKGKTKNWRCPLSTMKRYEKEDRLYYTKDGLARIKRYLDEVEGMPPLDIWTDIFPVNSQAKERLGYPTQKPETLLERIILSSSKKGDLVLDAFAGAGTTAAVAEKLERRWVNIDCGKLAINTIQKRLLNLRSEIGNKGKKFKVKPFTLFNAGLYDFSSLAKLPWESWRFFALQLFQCRDQPHKINGIRLDGKFRGSSVLVFDHTQSEGVRIDEETIETIHESLGNRVGSKMFIIAPALTFDFQQDYIDLDDVRYYALRIPYSIINELHHREFTALKQPSDEMEVNDTVDAVGFDFIRTPELKFRCGKRKPKGSLFEECFIKITTFKSEAFVRESLADRENLESLSMVMIDYDFDEKSQIFDLDDVFYGDDIRDDSGELTFRADLITHLKVMVVFIDIYGNEARVLIEPKQFGVVKKQSKINKTTNNSPRKKKATTKAKASSKKRSSKKTTAKKATTKKSTKKATKKAKSTRRRKKANTAR